MGATGARRRARGYALQVLYSLDGSDPPDLELMLGHYWDAFDHAEDDAAAVEFAEALVRGTMAARDTIDEVVQNASRNWRIERMSRVDRNILRLATYELTAADVEVPVRVVINEAIELAKRFGASDSPSFVNGILDRIAQGERDG
jgi:N utilization substance protein B